MYVIHTLAESVDVLDLFTTNSMHTKLNCLMYINLKIFDDTIVTPLLSTTLKGITLKLLSDRKIIF